MTSDRMTRRATAWLVVPLRPMATAPIITQSDHRPGHADGAAGDPSDLVGADMPELSARMRRRLAAGGDRGATAVEYALMVAFIAVAIVLTVAALGGALNGVFTAATGMLAGG